MPKWLWIVIAIVFFPIGTIAYFIWGPGRQTEEEKAEGKGKPYYRRFWFWVAAGFLFLIIVGAILDEPADETGTQPKPSASSVVTTSSKEPQKDYYDAGDPVRIGNWTVVATDIIYYEKSLGTVYLNKKADEGYSFVSILVKVTNNTDKTDSLTFATWKLTDNRGYTYNIQQGADMYLRKDERLNVSSVPPKALRVGYLVFQVMDDPKELFLKMSTTRGSAKWKVK